MMKKIDAQNLLDKYKAGNCTEEELTILEKWYKDLEIVPFSDISELDMESDLGDVYARLPIHEPKKVKLWPRIAIAVAVSTIIVSAGVWLLNKPAAINPIKQFAKVNDFAPGKSGATLTLGDGRQIRLSDAAHGELAEEAGISISKTSDGRLVYELKADKTDSNRKNTLTTARGETYIVTLPDKSQVWLNAASSLTYSAALLENGKRMVTLSGEAYFQVAKDKQHPFIVESRGQQVEVLGTYFNVNSYEDEGSIKTTLLEGSVMVSAGNASKVIKPNQQAVFEDGKVKVESADVEQAVAWKSGLFKFENTSMKAVLRQMSRWYDVDVVYDGNVPDALFTGKIYRSQNASHLLEMLKFYDLNYRIENKTIIISP